MKKNTLVAIFLVISSSSFSQWGITAGLNLSKYYYSVTSFDIDRKATMGFNVGIQYQKVLSEKLFLFPGLSYTVKGAQTYFSYPIGYTGPMKYNNHLNYLQLTLPAVAALPVSDALDVEVGAGLFAGYLLSAQSKIEEFDGSTSTEKFASDDFKHVDYGLQLAAGFRMGKKLGFHLKYDLGIGNISPSEDHTTMKTKNFSLNISWLFVESD